MEQVWGGRDHVKTQLNQYSASVLFCCFTLNENDQPNRPGYLWKRVCLAVRWGWLGSHQGANVSAIKIALSSNLNRVCYTFSFLPSLSSSLVQRWMSSRSWRVKSDPATISSLFWDLINEITFNLDQGHTVASVYLDRNKWCITNT